MDQHLAEDIVLLRMLTTEPARPSSIPIDNTESSPAATDPDWPLKHENKIVESLAFLSASTEDPKKVSAVCLERCSPQFDACIIRVAMNTGVTKEYMTGLKRLASALEDRHQRPKDVEDDRLLRTALQMNRKRILSRLRSKHACTMKSAGRASVVDRLRKMAEALTKVNSNHPLLTSLTPVVTELEDKFSQLEALPSKSVYAGRSDGLLLSLLYSLDNLPPLTTAAASLVGNRKCEFSDPESLLMAITKLRKYRAACHLLTAAVKKYAIFRKVTVADVSANITKPMSLRMARADDEAFNTAMSRLGLRWTITTPQRIGVELAEASAQFQQGMMKRKPKVHAEIQLLSYYESNPVLAAPRVICSSKAACFLCGLFIRSHGKYQISKTHGVLWPQWTLPDFQSMNLSQATAVAMHSGVAIFKAELERKIQLQWAQTRAKPMHPGESFTSLVRWTPSRVSLAQNLRSNANSQAAVDAIAVGDLDDPPSSSKQGLEVSATEVNMGQHTSTSQTSIQNAVKIASSDRIDRADLSVNAHNGDGNLSEARTRQKCTTLSQQDLPVDAGYQSREPGPDLAPTPCEPERVSVVRSSNDLDGMLQIEATPSIRDHGSRLRDASAENNMSELVRYSPQISLSALALRKFNFHDEKFSIYMELPIQTSITITRYREPCFRERDVVVDISSLLPGDSIDLDPRGTDGDSTIVVAKESRKSGKVWFEIKWK